MKKYLFLAVFAFACMRGNAQAAGLECPNSQNSNMTLKVSDFHNAGMDGPLWKPADHLENYYGFNNGQTAIRVYVPLSSGILTAFETMSPNCMGIYDFDTKDLRSIELVSSTDQSCTYKLTFDGTCYGQGSSPGTWTTQVEAKLSE